MLYNVAQFLSEPVGSVLDYRVDEPVITDVGTSERVQGFVLLTRTGSGIWARADLEVYIDLSCGRCLQGFRYPLGLTIDEECVPLGAGDEGQLQDGLGDAEDFFAIDQRRVLDLQRIVQQAVIVSRPMKPLCRPGCLGICSVCGEDRNAIFCQCTVQATDPRWRRLTELLQKPRDEPVPNRSTVL